MSFGPTDDYEDVWRCLDDISMAGVPGPVKLSGGRRGSVALEEHAKEPKGEAHLHGGA